MDARTFLQQFVEQIPTRGLDNINIYIYCQDPKNKDEIINFEIKEITNDGNNDALLLILSPSEN